MPLLRRRHPPVPPWDPSTPGAHAGVTPYLLFPSWSLLQANSPPCTFSPARPWLSGHYLPEQPQPNSAFSTDTEPEAPPCALWLNSTVRRRGSLSRPQLCSDGWRFSHRSRARATCKPDAWWDPARPAGWRVSHGFLPGSPPGGCNTRHQPPRSLLGNYQPRTSRLWSPALQSHRKAGSSPKQRPLPLVTPFQGPFKHHSAHSVGCSVAPCPSGVGCPG